VKETQECLTIITIIIAKESIVPSDRFNPYDLAVTRMYRILTWQ